MQTFIKSNYKIQYTIFKKRDYIFWTVKKIDLECYKSVTFNRVFWIILIKRQKFLCPQSHKLYTNNLAFEDHTHLTPLSRTHKHTQR